MIQEGNFPPCQTRTVVFEGRAAAFWEYHKCDHHNEELYGIAAGKINEEVKHWRHTDKDGYTLLPYVIRVVTTNLAEAEEAYDRAIAYVSAGEIIDENN